MKQILDRIERRLEAVGLSSNAASLKAGLSGDAIRNIRRAVERGERQGVSTHTIQALAPVLETTPSWLLEERGEEASMLVPVIGRVGADSSGEVILSTGQETGDMAPPPPAAIGPAVALEVTGHSMRGLADDGALIYFETQRTPPSPDMLGHVVVAEIEDGQVLVKRLLRGSEKGVYDLESLSGPTLRDVRIIWAAHITAIIPPFQARRVIVRSGTRAS